MPIPDHVRAELDLERVDPAKAERFIGKLAPASIDSYVPMWRRFRLWCRPPLDGREAPPRWLSPLPCTTDTLTDYVENLCQLGWAPSTIRRARAAIIAWHRLHGVPVPDGYDASVVLSEYKRSLVAAGWKPRRAEALPLDDVLDILRACPLDKPKGERDAVLLLLAYAAGLRPARLSALTIGDVTRLAGGELRIVAGDDVVHVGHWTAGADGGHDPDLCPCEIIADRWIGRRLRAAGCPDSDPVVRAVDMHGHIAGADDVYFGHAQPNRGGIDKRGLGYALAGMLTRAGVADPARFQWESLVLGGRVDRRLHGDTVDQLAAATGLRETSQQLLDVVRIAEQRRPEA